jgi:ATP-binding protein involved in chromosome partitioning
MFAKTNVQILGILENMSGFTAPDGTLHEIFGSGGGRKEAERLGVSFLGQLPLDPAIRIASDSGVPFLTVEPESPASRMLFAVVDTIGGRINLQGNP